MSDRRVMTEYGPGIVVASETVRGCTSYKVEGQGFSVWLTAQQVPEFGQLEWEQSENHEWDNSTTLPYNPQPQFPAWSTGESTIQPNQHVDPDKRLTPADSVTFEERPKTGPGPSRDLFAASGEYDDYSPLDAQSDPRSWSGDPNETTNVRDLNLPQMPDWEAEEKSWENDPVREYSRSTQHQREMDKYADVDPVIDRTSLQARLDEDPARVVNEIRMANWERSEGIDDRTRKAYLLEETDTHVRTAAWADVRKKAIRLRRGGQVQLEAANPSAIVATVTGDHGIYDVAVLRGNILTGSSAITEWSCSCPWGDWAFERQHTFVGRLCSHAYAAYLELQALNKRKDKPYGWSDKTSKRVTAIQVGDRVMTNYGDEATVVEYPEVLGDRTDDNYAVVQFDDGTEEALHAEQEISPIGTTAARYPRQDGQLSTEPGTLTPDLHHIPKVRRFERVDITEDERTDITRTSAHEVTAAPDWSLWPGGAGEWRSLTTTDGQYVAEVHQYGDAGPSGNMGTGTADWTIEKVGPGAYDFEEVERSSREYPSVPEAQAAATEALQKYGPVGQINASHEAAIESIHPNGWGPEVEALLKKLKGLWEESSRPGRNQERIDEIRDVTDELRDMGFDSSGVATAMRHAGIYDWDIEGFLHQAFLSEPFQGSGPVDKDSYGTSADYVDLHEGPYSDVDGPGNNPAQQNADDLMPRSSNRTASDEEVGGGDALAYLKEGGFGGGGDSEFASFQARLADELEEEKGANLRTAGRTFTFAEQQALMDEMPADGIPLGEDELDITGTHYLS